MGFVFVTDYEINSLCNYETKSWEKNNPTENKLYRNFFREIIVLSFSTSQLYLSHKISLSFTYLSIYQSKIMNHE